MASDEWREKAKAGLPAIALAKTGKAGTTMGLARTISVDVWIEVYDEGGRRVGEPAHGTGRGPIAEGNAPAAPAMQAAAEKVAEGIIRELLGEGKAKAPKEKGSAGPAAHDAAPVASAALGTPAPTAKGE